MSELGNADQGHQSREDLFQELTRAEAAEALTRIQAGRIDLECPFGEPAGITYPIGPCPSLAEMRTWQVKDGDTTRPLNGRELLLLLMIAGLHETVVVPIVQIRLAIFPDEGNFWRFARQLEGLSSAATLGEKRIDPYTPKYSDPRELPLNQSGRGRVPEHKIRRDRRHS